MSGPAGERLSFLSRRTVWVPAALLVLAAGSALLLYKVWGDPKVVWLSGEAGAQWIRFDNRPSPKASWAELMTRDFRTVVEVPPNTTDAVLTVRAFRAAAVFWDGEMLQSPRDPEQWSDWKQAREVPLAGRLEPGPHELRIRVLNDTGPPAVLAYCRKLGISSGPEWEARADGDEWSSAIDVDDLRPTEISRQFPPVYEVVLEQLPLLAGIWLLIGAATFVIDARKEHLGRWGSFALSVKTFRWVLLGLWTVLALNNHWKLPIETGFDVDAHWEYVEYILQHGRIPLAPEGWQMFQSPLYYLLTAVFFKTLSFFLDSETAAWSTRLIPLACGVLQVEVCYRGSRHVFPGRNDLQCLGLVLGSLIPMNLFMNQGFGNESLNSLFSAAVVAVGFKLLHEPHSARSAKWQIVLGLFLGLGLLSKVTPLLLVPPCFVILLYVLYRDGLPLGSIVAGCARTAVTCGLVTGWYYVRNVYYLGKPFIGGWDASREIVWWQMPGYRTLHQFTRFGESLEYPVYASYKSFWDGVYTSFWLDGNLSSIVYYDYRPPWNYDFMLAGAWLAVLPTIAILLGGCSTLWRKADSTRDCLVFAVVCIAIYFAALIDMNLSVPFYSHARAMVTLGLIPCYAALGAAGFDLMTRNRLARAAVYGFVGCWAVFAYVAFFVVS